MLITFMMKKKGVYMSVTDKIQEFFKSVKINGGLILTQFSESQISELEIPNGVTILITDENNNIWVCTPNLKFKVASSGETLNIQNSIDNIIAGTTTVGNAKNVTETIGGMRIPELVKIVNAVPYPTRVYSYNDIANDTPIVNRNLSLINPGQSGIDNTVIYRHTGDTFSNEQTGITVNKGLLYKWGNIEFPVIGEPGFTTMTQYWIPYGVEDVESFIELTLDTEFVPGYTYEFQLHANANTDVLSFGIISFTGLKVRTPIVIFGSNTFYYVQILSDNTWKLWESVNGTTYNDVTETYASQMYYRKVRLIK